jgi:hypothetical protein
MAKSTNRKPAEKPSVKNTSNSTSKKKNKPAPKVVTIKELIVKAVVAKKGKTK